jgi:hypothetical protein
MPDPTDYMSVWEAFLEHEDNYKSLHEVKVKVGTAEFRQMMVNYTKTIVEAYELAKSDYGDPFDWEFCPAALRFIDEKPGLLGFPARLSLLVMIDYEERETERKEKMLAQTSETPS